MATCQESEAFALQPKATPFTKGLRQWAAAFPFLILGLVMMGMFVLYPLARNIQISFTDYNIIKNQADKVVFFKHYLHMLQDEDYLIALRNTLLYALITVPGQIFLGLVLANLLNQKIRGKTAFKVMAYLPVITSWVVVSLIFRYIFMSGKGGLVNYLLMGAGLLSQPVAWLQGEWTANIVLWVFGIWKGVGWVMIVYLAALQSIPKEVYEAAQMDGATPVQSFFCITFPMVRNTTLYLLTVLVIGAFGAYIHVMMITEGGPLGKTNQLMNMMYNTAFSKYDFGYASAQAVTMGVIILVLTVLQRQLAKETTN